MYIGLIIYGALDTLSGGYLYDRVLVDYLRAAGHTVKLVSLPNRTYPRHLTDNFNRQLLDQLAAEPFDILLQDELNHPSLVWLNGRLKGRTRYPIVSIIHHLRCSEDRSPLANFFYRALERRYLRSVDGFVFNSQTSRQAVANLIGPLPAHVVAYPAGDRFEAIRGEIKYLRDSDPKFFTILFVGNLIPRKNLHLLIHTAELLPPQTFRFDVVGDLNVDPFYALNMMRLVEERHLQGMFNFSGRLDDNELAFRFVHSDLLVVPSTYEGFGIVYLEAMGFGMPAIGSIEGAAGEIIDHGRTGYLIQPDDPAALAQLLRQLHDNRSLLAQMGEAALARFQAHPTWVDTCRTVEQFLQNMNQSPNREK